MDKLKFIGLVLGGWFVFMLFASILMPFLASTATDAADFIEADSHASSYVLTTAGLRYAPWFLYFIPSALAIGLIVFKLKHKGRSQ